MQVRRSFDLEKVTLRSSSGAGIAVLGLRCRNTSVWRAKTSNIHAAAAGVQTLAD